jgi:hypothetical protein
VKRITIGNASYLAGSVPAVVGGIVKTPSVKTVLALIRACPRAQSWGFVSTRGAGVVAWVPDSIFRCFGVTGGGPLNSPCLQKFHTPLRPNPTRIPGVPASIRYFVLIAATSTATCADLSTQVPGGVWARTTATVGSVPRGTLEVVKCQVATTSGLVDFVAPFSRSLPVSKPGAFAIFDRFVGTGADRLDGVPRCNGVSF